MRAKIQNNMFFLHLTKRAALMTLLITFAISPSLKAAGFGRLLTKGAEILEANAKRLKKPDLSETEEMLIQLENLEIYRKLGLHNKARQSVERIWELERGQSQRKYIPPKFSR